MKKPSAFPLFCLCLSGLLLSGETAVPSNPGIGSHEVVEPVPGDAMRPVPPRILDASLEALRELQLPDPAEPAISGEFAGNVQDHLEALPESTGAAVPPVELPQARSSGSDPENPADEASPSPGSSIPAADPVSAAAAITGIRATPGSTSSAVREPASVGPMPSEEPKASSVVPVPRAADPVKEAPRAVKPDSQPQFTRNLPDAKAIPVRDGESIVASNSILSYYGHPNSKRMGILGEHSIDDLVAHMKKIGAEYDYGNGEKGVVFAFHIIFGTVWKGGDIGYLNKQKLQSYIDYAEKNGMLVFLDHQLGKFGVSDSLKTMLPYLSYRSVHLAIDPEWHTPVPGEKLGSIEAEELNEAQAIMSDWMKANGVPGRKMLMVHQFNYTMIRNRERVKATYPNVDLIHNADGFGNPGQKYGSYNYNKLATNMPLKGFKLFYPTTLRDWGWDNPILKPSDVLKLDPQPVLIMYQ